jgi:hypothetical protein
MPPIATSGTSPIARGRHAAVETDTGSGSLSSWSEDRTDREVVDRKLRPCDRLVDVVSRVTDDASLPSSFRAAPGQIVLPEVHAGRTDGERYVHAIVDDNCTPAA